MTDTAAPVSAPAAPVDSAPAPGRYDSATEARLDQLDRAATRYVEDNRPQRTRDAYAADWKAWQQ
ncbi:hypothetical protein [Streptomyces sp. NPDC004830]